MGANLRPMTRWWAYVQRIARSASQKEIAEAAGVSQPTVSRWAKGEIEAASADAAVRLALHYEASVGDALVAAGVLDAEHLPVTTQRIEKPSDEQLLAILAARLRQDREERGGNDRDAAPTNPAEVSSAPEDDVSDLGYMLAARDTDDDEEVEAQQIEP